MKHFQKSAVMLFGALLIHSIVLTAVFAEGAPDVSKAIVKVDSDGLCAEIIVTGRAAVPEGLGVDSPQARLLTKKAAVSFAYDSLVKIVEAIAPDYFPKERYFSEGSSVKGARLIEVRYLGDGSAEADVELDIALSGPLANKFEKEMRLAGYRVVEYDRPDTKITGESLKLNK